jgi:hypothetical protein
MKGAAMVWVIVGGFGFIHMVAWLALVGENRIAGLPVGCIPSGPVACCCGGLVGLPYLIAGYRALTGRAGDPQGYGVVSILLGLLQLVASAVYGLAGTDAQNGKVPGALFVLSAILGVFGTALVVAGGLALAGRSAYREWRRSQALVRYRQHRKRHASDDAFEE